MSRPPGDASSVVPSADHEGAPRWPGRIGGRSAWYGPQLAERPHEWMHRLGEVELSEIDEAVAKTKRRGVAVSDITRADFPLPTLGPMLERIREELLDGLGFSLLRGAPLEGRSLEDATRICWGVSVWLGQPRPQNAEGERIGHVQDLGHDPSDASVRIYQTNRRQTYHTDSADLTSLMCVRPARRGGRFSLVSSMTIYNEILERRPDLVPCLFDPFPTDRRGEIPDGMLPYFPIPIFHWFEGYLSAIYSRTYILSSQRLPEAPRLGARQLAAMALLDELAEDPALNLFIDFQPGDIQLLHNHQLLHDRTAFEDWPEPERKRHLLRMWLSPPQARPLPDVFALRYGSTTIGDRGGIFVSSREVE